MKVISLPDLLQEDYPEPPSLMGRGLLVPKGKVLVYGDPGSYKSFFIHQWLYHLSEGLDWFGYPVHQKVASLYVELEISRKAFQHRALKLQQYTGLPGSLAYYAMIDDFTLAGSKAVDTLVEAVLSVNAGIVFLDPLNLLLKGSEVSDDVINVLTKSLSQVRRRTGAAGGLVAHMRKGMYYEGSRVDAGPADISGSKNLWTWPDTILRLSKVKDEKNTIEVKWEKTRTDKEPAPFRLHFNEDKLVLELAQSDPFSYLLELAARGPLRVTEVDEMMRMKTGKSPSAVLQLRKQAVEQGLVEIVSDPENHKRRLLRLPSREETP